LRDLDPAPLAVGALVGLAGALFLAQPLGPVRVAGQPFQPVVLSTAALASGFGLGGAVFLRRGRRLVGLAHAVGAFGWGLVALASGIGSLAALWLGLAVVIGGSVAVAVRSRSLR
jgi:hypothetical protein